MKCLFAAIVVLLIVSLLRRSFAIKCPARFDRQGALTLLETWKYTLDLQMKQGCYLIPAAVQDVVPRQDFGNTTNMELERSSAFIPLLLWSTMTNITL
uniref:Lipocalin n=1 Tax=Rhipicephalus appendiculatus TaxID=34631 RepID=A0A131YGS3_RHIAP